MNKAILILSSVTLSVALTSALVMTNRNKASTILPADIPLQEVPVPVDQATRNKLSTVNRLTLNGVERKVSYTQLMKTGHQDNGEIFGALKDENGTLIKHPDGSPVICNGTSNSPTVEGSGLDFTSIIEKDGKLHMVSQFECHVGAIYTAELQQSKDGRLRPVANTLKYIDQSAYKGGWVHCAGTKTPWNSHLGSEELEPDARFIEEQGAASERYFASARHFFGGDIDKLNPYYYGWIPEVTFKHGNAVYQKHYALGRASHELAYVMPDNKTVYLTDDGTNSGFYRFVADTAANLDTGHLYAAKWIQTTAMGGGAANLEWIHLGHIKNDEVKALALSGKLAFSDVLSVDDVLDAATGTCHPNFTYTNTEFGQECLAYKDINGDAVIDSKDKSLAAALEKRRVAAMQGATTEFRKFEGFTYNARDNKAYIAISAIDRGMMAGFSSSRKSSKYDAGGNNDINLAYNPCGAIYEIGFDKSGDSMKATSMKSILEGIALPKADKNGNRCHPDHIANPDNIAYISASDTLIVSEDSSRHINNAMWAYQVDKRELTRIATMELDAEATGPYWQQIGNFGYISMVSQHPLEKQAVDPSRKESTIGVLGPIPLN